MPKFKETQQSANFRQEYKRTSELQDEVCTAQTDISNKVRSLITIWDKDRCETGSQDIKKSLEIQKQSEGIQN